MVDQNHCFFLSNETFFLPSKLHQFVNTPGLEVRRASSQQQVVGMPIKAIKMTIITQINNVKFIPLFVSR